MDRLLPPFSPLEASLLLSAHTRVVVSEASRRLCLHSLTTPRLPCMQSPSRKQAPRGPRLVLTNSNLANVRLRRIKQHTKITHCLLNHYVQYFNRKPPPPAAH